MSKTLLVNGVEKKSTLINYDDLFILYSQFVKKYNNVPTIKEINSAHNMPQQRIVKRVLYENNVTYNEFLNFFWKNITC